MIKEKHDVISYCGIYCGACPSFQERNTCFGCRSEDKSQKRKSKWNCDIRSCCIEQKKQETCFSCNEYPCSKLIKLKNTHLDDERYEYRHKILYNLVRISKIGLEEWLIEQEKIWTCPKCEGPIVFYENKCVDCGETLTNILKEYVKKNEESQ